jgi:hypothetical protein
MKKIIIFTFVTLLSLSTFAKRSKVRKPASGDTAVVLSYVEISRSVPLNIHIYPYGNYRELFGVVMNCSSEESGDDVNWSCSADVESGSAHISFKEGFKAVLASKVLIKGKGRSNLSFKLSGLKTQ